jgi:hypothetical protein
MATAPSLDALIEYAETLSSAAQRSDVASSLQHRFVNGGVDEVIQTESGPLPSLAKWKADTDKLFADVKVVVDSNFRREPVDPEFRSDDSPLQVGDEYFNTSELVKRVWNGAIWYTPNADGQTILRDLRDPDNTSKGAGMVGWRRVPLDADSAPMSSLLQILSTKPISIWEYAKYVTSMGDRHDPSSWDWTPAMAQLALTGRDCHFTEGCFKSNPIAWLPGVRLIGEGGNRGDSNRTVIESISPRKKLFSTTPSTSTTERAAIVIAGMELCSDYPLTIGDPSVTILDGGASPYEMKPYLSDFTLRAKTDGVGEGLVLAKCFDHVVEHGEITGFARGIVEVGCDLGSIRNCRIRSFSEYGILQLSTATFGSQSDITKNDILDGGADSVYIKSTARHVRIHDNYLERGGVRQTCKGFIDLSDIASPVYWGNVVSSTQLQTISLADNRIDGMIRATEFVRRVDVVKAVSVYINEPYSTTTGKVKSIIVGDEFGPNRLDISVQPRDVRIFDQSFDRWHNFASDSIEGLERVTPACLGAISSGKDQTASLRIRSGTRIVMPVTFLTTSRAWVLQRKITETNQWFAEGVTYTCRIRVRTTSSEGDTLLMAAGSNSHADIPNAFMLTTQFKSFTFVFAGAPENYMLFGFFLSRSTNNGDIEIASIDWK